MLYALAWTPVILVMVLATVFRRPALDLAIAGLAYTFLLCLGFYHTPAVTLILAGVDGIFRTLPLLLVVLAGIALSTVLLAAGNLQRIVGWYSDHVGGQWHQAALLSFGVGNFMEGAGVIAEPVVAPMLRSAGLSPSASAVLSISGYSGLMTLALGGIIVKVLSTVTEIPIVTLSKDIAILSLLPTLLFALSTPWIVESWGALRKQWPLFLATGTTAGLVAWGSAVWAGPAVAVLFAGLAVIAMLILQSRRQIRLDRAIFRDFAPFILIVAGLGSVNLIPALHRLTYDNMGITFSVIPNRPCVLHPLYDAYTYLFAALLLALKTIPFRPGERKRLLVQSVIKAWRPVVAMGLFGAMGQIIAYSGYSSGFSSLDKNHNLAWILAEGTYHYTGSFYPIFAPLLGWVGTFLTGYGVASIMLFGKFQLAAADLLGLSPSTLASALAIGASIGSVSSPFKIALATPLCDAVGKEGELLRKTIPLGILVSLAMGVTVWLML